jgi:hypothetical protein
MKRKLTLVLALITMGAMLTSAAFASTMYGVVYDDQGNPLQGATVTQFRSDGSHVISSVTTSALGEYYISEAVGDSGFVVEKEGYTMPVRWQLDGNATASQDWVLKPLASQYTGVSDTFDSLANWGVMGTATASGGSLQMTGGDRVRLDSGWSEGYADISMTFRKGGTGWTAIGLRQTTSGAINDYYQGTAGQAVFINSDGTICINKIGNGGPNSAGTFGSVAGTDWGVDHSIRILANGYKTTVWFDGGLVGSVNYVGQSPELPYSGFNYAAPSNDGYWNATPQAGTITLFAFGGTTLDVRSVTIATPEPGSIIAILTGMVGLVGFARRRRA